MLITMMHFLRFQSFGAEMPPAHSKFSIITLCDKIKKSESAIAFLKEHGVLNSSAKCSKCSKELNEIYRKSGTSYYYFSCSDCGTMVSIRDGTILSRAHIGIRTFALLAYTFVMCQGLTLNQKIHEVDKQHVTFTSLFELFSVFVCCLH